MSRGYGTTLGVGATDAIDTGFGTAQTGDITIGIDVYRNGEGGGNLGRMWEKRVAGVQSTNFYNSLGNTAYGFRQDSNGGASSAVNEIVRPAAGGWHHFGITCNLTALLTPVRPLMYLDGVSVAVNTISDATVALTTNTDSYVIGNRLNDSARNWDGMLAGFFLAGRIFTPAEMFAIGAEHYSPLFFSRSLLVYHPDIRDAIDHVTGLLGTVTGTVVQPHPPIRFPRRGRSRYHQVTAAIQSDPPLFTQAVTRWAA